MPIQPKAAGFNQTSATYERGRPEYPEQALRTTFDALGIHPASTVVDLGAGSGKFTGTLAKSGATILAVEPVEGMREKFRRLHPGITLLCGSAENIPLPDHSADAVVAAQAFHWFDGAAALAEIHRVLRPGGRLGLLWNVRDESDPLMAAITKIIDPFEDGAPRYRTMQWRRAFETTTLFSPLEKAEFAFEQVGDTQMVLDRFGSVSFIVMLPEAERLVVLDRIRQACQQQLERQGGGPIRLPYLATLFWCERLGD